MTWLSALAEQGQLWGLKMGFGRFEVGRCVAYDAALLLIGGCFRFRRTTMPAVRYLCSLVIMSVCRRVWVGKALTNNSHLCPIQVFLFNILKSCPERLLEIYKKHSSYTAIDFVHIPKFVDTKKHWVFPQALNAGINIFLDTKFYNLILNSTLAL